VNPEVILLAAYFWGTFIMISNHLRFVCQRHFKKNIQLCTEEGKKFKKLINEKGFPFEG